MSNRQQLQARWKTEAGASLARTIGESLQQGTVQEEVHALIADLPFKDEVAPALDLRGIEIPSLISIAESCDLSGVRFDVARLNWNFSGAILRNAVFDGAEGANVDFGGCDLQGSSFVKARLPGAIFFKATLRNANLTGIRMRSGQLKGSDCSKAIFTGADLRLVWAADADLRDCDLRQANLVGASLGGAAWNDETQLSGAQISSEGTPDALCAFALSQGATVQSEDREWQLSLIDATVKALQNETGIRVENVIDLLKELRPKVDKDPSVLWANELQEKLSKKEWQAAQDAVQTAAINMGALLE